MAEMTAVRTAALMAGETVGSMVQMKAAMKAVQTAALKAG